MMRRTIEDLQITSGEDSAWARVDVFPSPTAFAQETLLRMHENAPQSHRRKGMENVFSVLQNGWPEVMDRVRQVDEDSLSAYAPKRIQHWEYSGSRLSVDRMLLGKPCIAKPRKKSLCSNKFVRFVFVAEAMSCAGEENFVEKLSQFLSYVRAAESKGQRVEAWLAFGGYRGVFSNPSKASITFSLAKGFNEACNYCTLSALGHSSLLRTLQFGWEESQRKHSAPGGQAVIWRETYKQAFGSLVGEEEAKTATIICDPANIDPAGWLKRDFPQGT